MNSIGGGPNVPFVSVGAQGGGSSVNFPINPLSPGVKFLRGTVVGSDYSGMYDYTGTSYQVPVGKKLVIVAVRGVLYNSNAGSSFIGRIGYCDNSIPMDSSTTPTNPLGFYVQGSILGASGPLQSGAAVASQIGSQYYAEVPASKYLFINRTSTNYAVVEVIGFEIAA